MRSVHFDFDAGKCAANLVKHGKDFEEAKLMWTLVGADATPHNVNSGETVYLLAAVYEEKVWGVMYVERGDKIRILSFRRLNDRERKIYGFT